MDQSQNCKAACNGSRAMTVDRWAADDLLDLSYDNVKRMRVSAKQPQSTMVKYRGGTVLSFEQIARIIPCFTAGTRIITPNGEVAAETLRQGDRVLTRDNGFQTITWAGCKKMTLHNQPVTPDMRPVMIRRGALGPNSPERDMIVSPNHRMLLVGMSDQPGDSTECLLAAKNMTHLPGIDFVPLAEVTYVHFMCDRHEIVSSDGAWTETFQPNDDSMHGIDQAQRAELLSIFPQLATQAGRATYATARQTISAMQSDYLLSA